MTAIHQFVPDLRASHGTCHHVLALRDVLQAAGFESDIFVEIGHDETSSEVTSFEQYTARAETGDVLLYHVSDASPLAEFLAVRRETLVLDVHSLTPPHVYAGWDDHAAHQMDIALAQVAALAPRVALGIGDSTFEASEMRRFGCRRTEVVPLLVDTGPWPDVDGEEVGHLAAAHGQGTVLLFVGRISPDEGVHRLIETLWLYRRWFDPKARMHLVGPVLAGSYAEAVFAFAEEIGLGASVRHAQYLSPAQLASWYADADVFLTLSEHEGFGAALVGAMRAGLPIVALDAGGVPETVGDGALVLHDSRPTTAAIAVDRVLGDPHLVRTLVDAGQRRLAQLDAGLSGARFVELLFSVAMGEAVPA